MDTEVSQEHHGRTSQCTKSTRNLIRDKIINQSKEWSPYVLESQQTCSLSDNLSILQGRETVFNDPRRKEKLRGLQAILQEMLLEEPFDVNNQKKVGFMAFDDAFALYMGFQSTQDFSHQAKYNFQCAILHPNTGLCVNILVIPGSREKVIILCPDRSLDFTFLYDFLVKHFYSDRKEEFTKEEIDIVVDSVTSEWDKQVVKYILCRTRTAEEMKLLGVKQETMEKIRDRVPLVLEEVRHSSAVVNNEVSENISNKIEKLESKIQAKKKLLLRKSKSWTK
ncbi:RNA-directed DNA polymerase from transposon X-element, partial [Paramuricea clavata]